MSLNSMRCDMLPNRLSSRPKIYCIAQLFLILIGRDT
jgi:hypothetical protein